MRDSLKLPVMRRFFAVNRDIFLRTVCLIAVTTFFTSSGARQGDMILAVNTLLMQLFTLFSYILDGFAYAGEALAGRYVGARDLKSLRHAVRNLFGWGGAMALGFTLLYAVGGKGFLELLTSDREVVQVAGTYFYWVLAIPVAAGAFFLIYYTFSGSTDNQVLWLAFLVYLALRGIMQTVWSRSLFTEAYLARIGNKNKHF